MVSAARGRSDGQHAAKANPRPGPSTRSRRFVCWPAPHTRGAVYAQGRARTPGVGRVVVDFSAWSVFRVARSRGRIGGRLLAVVGDRVTGGTELAVVRSAAP